MPPPAREYVFAPPRKFRWDFCWIDQKIAVEVEGGLYGKGGHNSITGVNRDCEKGNLATLNGWRVLRFTEKMLTHDPEGCIQMVAGLLSKGNAGSYDDVPLRRSRILPPTAELSG